MWVWDPTNNAHDSHQAGRPRQYLDGYQNPGDVQYLRSIWDDEWEANGRNYPNMENSKLKIEKELGAATLHCPGHGDTGPGIYDPLSRISVAATGWRLTFLPGLETEQPPDPENINKITSTYNDDTVYNFSDKTILIVEDEGVNYKFLELILHKTNANTFHAETGEDAINYVKIYPEIDIVLMDIKLPDITGYETTRQIKKLKKNIPVIAQTAFAMPGDADKAIEAGCDNYISKPINSWKLLELIDRYFEEK